MCGQSTAYNTYATLPTTNPLFMGFSGYTNALKEIIIRTLETLVNTGLQGFLFTQFQAVGTYLTFTFIFLVGLSMAEICQRLKLPRIIGMLLTGIILGPYVLDLLDLKILCISAELRQMALLFVLVGAAVDIRYTMEAGAAAVLMILVALLFRSVGVAICLLGTSLNKKEKLFCMIAYLPKATVQAAIGSVPLAMGLPCGKIVLSVAVLAILLTAPLGAVGMDVTYRRFLEMTGKEK